MCVCVCVCKNFVLRNCEFDLLLNCGNSQYVSAKCKVILDLPHVCDICKQTKKKTQTKCRKAIIDKYEIDKYEMKGLKGANTAKVLNDFCSQYRLHCQEIQGNENVISVLNKRRPVLARFWLTGPEWYNFSKFYKKKPTGILEKEDLYKYKSDSDKSGGHAVILMRVEPKCLVFMNSWGEDFADLGFFRVKDINVLKMKCYDVYWTLNDLFQSEIQNYQKSCKENTKNMINQHMPSAFYKLNYQCPMCLQYSAIETYAGDIFTAQCPKCSHIFCPNLNALFDSLADYQLNINNS